jgi:hypothetical protein
MQSSIRTRLSYANVMATVAAFLALGGVSYAAATVGSSQIVNNSVKSKDLRQRTIRGVDVRKNTLGGKHIKESKLGRVPDAQTLQGIGPQGFVAAGTLVRYSFNLAGGETREVLSHGPLKLIARCIDNGANQAGVANQDAARLYVTTTQDGSLLSGSDTLDGGPAAGDFLNAATAETDAVWSENSHPDGTVDAIDGGDDDLAVASAPDGSTISGLWDQGVHGVNVFGAACSFRGWVITQ